MARLWLEADERVPSVWRMKQMRVSQKISIHEHLAQERSIKDLGKEGRHEI